MQIIDVINLKLAFCLLTILTGMKAFFVSKCINEKLTELVNDLENKTSKFNALAGKKSPTSKRSVGGG